MTGAQKKKIDAYKRMDSRKSDEYEMTGAQKINAMDEMTCARKKKTDAYEMDSQGEYMMGAQKKTYEYELMDSQKIREYEVTGAQKKTYEYEC